MKLDGVPPGVSSPSSEFHLHRAPLPPSSPRCGASWVPPRREGGDQDAGINHLDCAALMPHLEQDRPPLSVVVVRGMPPLPTTTCASNHDLSSHMDPQVARSCPPSNVYNGSWSNTGSEHMKFSFSTFRLQPRTPTVTRSNSTTGRGGCCRGRKRTAGGMSAQNVGNASSIRAGASLTVNSKQQSDENDAGAPQTDKEYPGAGLGLGFDKGVYHPVANYDVAVTPSSSSLCEPKSPHVMDSALVTLQSLSLRSPGGPSSPCFHEIMFSSPNSSTIKRTRGGSSFSVYTSSPAGSLPSATSTRPSTTCNSARSSPRVVPLTVIMTESQPLHNNDHRGGGATNVSNASPFCCEMKTPTRRPPFLGIKPAAAGTRERILDKRTAAVSFESPSSAGVGGTSPSTPLPKITLTPRNSSASRESSLPVFPSPASGGDDSIEGDDGLPKFWIDHSSPMAATPTTSSVKQALRDSEYYLHHPFLDAGDNPSPQRHYRHPHRRNGAFLPRPVHDVKLPRATSSFQHFGSSNSLALSADGSQDLSGYPQMSPMMEDSRSLPRSFLPFPNWLDTNGASSLATAGGIMESPDTVGGIMESPGTPLSQDHSGAVGRTELPTPQHTNCGKPLFHLGGVNDEEPMLFGIKTKSLLAKPSVESSHFLVQAMLETDTRYRSHAMETETGSLSDSEDDDEPFLLVSPKEIVEERLMAKRARLRRQWIGDAKSVDGTSASTFANGLSLTSLAEGASNTSLFGMDIPQDETSVGVGRFVVNPNSVSATSFPSHADETSVSGSGSASSICRRRSDGSLGSLGLSLEVVSANTNHMSSIAEGSCTGRDLITPPVLLTSRATELSPPPFAPKQDPLLLFADEELSSSRRNNNKRACFLAPVDRLSVHSAIARIEAAATAFQDADFDGGVDDDASIDHPSMDED